MRTLIAPKALPPNGTIAVCAASGPSERARIIEAARHLEARGYRVVIAGNVDHRHRDYLAGSDAERLAELNHYLRSADNDAIFFAHLRETGNITRAARAAGFGRRAAYDRRKLRPGFARRWEAALDEAEISVALQLAAELANAAPAGAAAGTDVAAAPGAFDPRLALAFLEWRERQREKRQKE